ncbi:WW domain binding protein 11-domain-containing protein [Lasiosphaeria miniovina]|uniref:WW domain binding protein 11-domain-containing protein n=1 Tax=Lasiosphaeria miniovina TaxID=1954250 RepID=A0AA40BG45_9PEZI|nr:WW domain binding protein 11-domain-containing protein [Lasiosphaeria miniovina]KAK0733622.1 WW domain binding protein 11-domain-containing protein [Lasiosphaeria miniovina]
MPKERNYNPVQAQRKADKAKAIKKGKSEQQIRRNEKLAKLNPDRIQQQINDLKAIKEGGSKLTTVEEQSLEALEKDLKAVRKAREALGDQAPTFSKGPPKQGGPRGDVDHKGALGKRRRDGERDESSSDSDVPADVKKIPMPRDTPPPIPKEVLDAWYSKRRAKRGANQQEPSRRPGNNNSSQEPGTSANREPLGDKQRFERTTRAPSAPSAPSPVTEAKTVYEAKPVLRDLHKEAVSAFVPTVVRMKIEKVKGQGGLLEPEEADRLEREGYLKTTGTLQQQPTPSPAVKGSGLRGVTVEEVDDEEG